MTLPNALTLARLALAPVFAILLLAETAPTLWAASGAFTLAAITDTVDGWLARRTGTVSRMGRALDPLADKLLVALALVAFVRLGIPGVETWMVAAIVGREVLVTALRSVASRRGVGVPVSRLGKWKTTFQMGFVFALLATLSVRAVIDPAPEFWEQPGATLETPFRLAFLVTTLITILSGLDYAWKARAALGSPGRPAA